jgi:hypothetical protein
MTLIDTDNQEEEYIHRFRRLHRFFIREIRAISGQKSFSTAETQGSPRRQKMEPPMNADIDLEGSL